MNNTQKMAEALRPLRDSLVARTPPIRRNTVRPINAHVPKINKAKAFTLVDMLRNGAQLTDDELDQLYVYFSPARATASKCRDAFAWVALAVGVKDVRPYLHHVVVRGGLMYGSDGHRCHRAATDLPDGRYCPLHPRAGSV